jgi:hypothetical protein
VKVVEAPVSPLRRLPVPVSEPNPLQTHQRTRPQVPPTQGTLALAFTERQLDSEVDPVFGPQPTSTKDLPDPKAACSAMVQAVVEVLGGIRPASQLARWLAADVYNAISRRASLAARMRRGAVPPGRAAVVRAVRVCLPADGIVEGSAVVIEQGRVRAVALRLEGLDGRWRATAVEIG